MLDQLLENDWLFDDFSARELEQLLADRIDKHVRLLLRLRGPREATQYSAP